MEKESLSVTYIFLQRTKPLLCQGFFFFKVRPCNFTTLRKFSITHLHIRHDGEWQLKEILVGKVTFAFILSALVGEAIATNKVVYGNDDRKDLYQVTNSVHARIALATAAMVDNNLISVNRNTATLNFDETLETGMNVCPSERFSQQPIGANCSGFLVGNDTLVTAGHCMQTQRDCSGNSWVFNYSIRRQGQNPLAVLASDVYRCKRIVKTVLTDTQDFAVIKLERPVSGRSPLQFRTLGKIADGTPLVVIGHPSGLPTKVAAEARVLDNSAATTFGANLDTFQGNSGSGVFNALTGQLEGILVQGKTDYRPNLASNPRSCRVVNRCVDTGVRCEFSPAGDTLYEVVTRITLAAPHIRARR